MKMIQRSEPFSSATISHLRIAQNTMAVKNDDEAYTSPSTAENQNESENVYAKAPTIPLPNIVRIVHVLISFSPLWFQIFLPKAVIVQKRNKMVNALISALRLFTICAA